MDRGSNATQQQAGSRAQRARVQARKEASRTGSGAKIRKMATSSTRPWPCVPRAQLLGLKTQDGKAASDEATVSQLLLKPGLKIMMMG